VPEYSVFQLVEMYDSGEIDIPELQREFIWSDNQVRDLAESIYKRYPIGLLTLFRLPEKLRTRNKRFWVLDGQQRILSLVLITKGVVEVRRRGRSYTKRLDIWFDPRNDRLEIRRPPKEGRWIKLHELIGITKREELERFMRERGFNAEEQVRISTLWSVFKTDYKILTHELPPDLDLDDLGNIFVRTNFGGTRVRGSDVYSTMMAIAREDLVKSLRSFTAGLALDIDYGVLIRTFIAFLTDGKVRFASRVLEQARRLRKILADNEDRINTIERDVKEFTSRAIELLRERGVMDLPSQNVIPVMSYYLYKKGEISPREEEGLFKWFVLASYFRRYSASVETRLNEDLGVLSRGGDYRSLINKILEREGNLRERIKADIDAGRWDKLFLYALLRQSGAKDFGEQELNTRNATKHHIFPRNLRISRPEVSKFIEDIGNITLLNYDTNQRLSDELPENYLRDYSQEIIFAHYIPGEESLWKLENIESFIDERKKLLKEAVDMFFHGVGL